MARKRTVIDRVLEYVAMLVVLAAIPLGFIFGMQMHNKRLEYEAQFTAATCPVSNCTVDFILVSGALAWKMSYIYHLSTSNNINCSLEYDYKSYDGSRPECPTDLSCYYLADEPCGTLTNKEGELHSSIVVEICLLTIASLSSCCVLLIAINLGRSYCKYGHIRLVEEEEMETKN